MRSRSALSTLFRDDHALLAQEMVLYDALYAWCREQQSETRGVTRS